MNENDDIENLQAPPELVSALQNVHKERVFVPPSVDEAILRQGREHIGSTQRKIVLIPRWLAMAASFALAAGLFAYFNFSRKSQTFAAGDINQDGQVDILDAFVLARSIEEGNGRAQDFNQDGSVDQKDAESLALEAVHLNGDGPTETSFFDTNYTNFHELGNQLPRCWQAFKVMQTLDARDLPFQFVLIREIRVSPFLLNLEGDRS